MIRSIVNTGVNKRIIEALVEFGFSRSELNPDLFLAEGDLIAFGVAPVRVDFISRIDGVEYLDAKPRRVRGKYGDNEVYFIGKEDLLQNKRSTTRAKDKADIEELA